MRITNDQYQAILARQAARKRTGARPIVQEQQDDRKGTPHHGPEEAEVDGPVQGRFRVTIDVFVSDKRRRDLDGAASTLLDCLISTRRLLAERAGIDRQGKPGGQG